MSDWLTKYIPGNPVTLVRNMPGATSMIGCNYVYNIAKKDGLTLLAGDAGSNLSSLLQLKGVEYDLTKMPIVLSGPSGQFYYIKADLIKNFKDIFEKEIIIYGARPPGGGLSTAFILARELLQFKTKKLVLAYAGAGDARRAFLSGELNTSSDTTAAYASQVLPMEKKGEIKMLWQSGTLDEMGNVIRVDPPFGHIPSVYERYVEVYGKPPSGKVWEAFKTILVACVVFEKSIAFPPGTPPEIVSIVSDASEKIVKDPQFIASADVKLQSTFTAGASMRKVFDRNMIRANPEAINWLRTWLREKWGVE
jgi:tripartite-type tricarboxylate transporter receptor subunit TctC